MKKKALRLAISLVLFSSIYGWSTTWVMAASPTAKPTSKTIAKPTSKSPIKSSAKATVKPSAKISASTKVASKPATSKPGASTKPKISTTKSPIAPVTTKKNVVVPKKAVAPKRVVRRAAVKRVVSPLASPSPKWPPKGFRVSDGIYAKVPSGNELVSIISAQKKLALQVQKCETNACGAVLVASTTGCLWWEIDSSIYGPSSADPTKQVEYGTLRTTSIGTKAKEISTILLMSSEPLADSVVVGNIAAKCWSAPASEKVPNNTYIPNANR